MEPSDGAKHEYHGANKTQGMFIKGEANTKTDAAWLKGLSVASKYADYGKKIENNIQKETSWETLPGVIKSPWNGLDEVTTEYITKSSVRNHSKLLHSEAKFRSAHIEPGTIHYSIIYYLDSGSEFDGQVTIHFTLKSDLPTAAPELFFDYAGDEITRYIVNGVPASPYGMKSHFSKGKVWIPASLLKPPTKQNTVTFGFRSVLFSDYGLVNMTTNTDERVIYAWSEPFWNNRMFPMFDQPDLKASFQLNLLVPKGYVAVSSVDPTYELAWEENVVQRINNLSQLILEEQTRKYLALRHTFPTKGHFDLWSARFTHKLIVFPNSEIISSYLFNFAVGTLSIYEYTPKIKIYYLKNYHAQAHPERWAKWFCSYTSVSLDYCAEVFATPYPFTKCDVIMIPELNAGAMEYPGAVMYNADNLNRSYQRGEISVERRSGIGKTIAHEISHMWFGNIVSVYWWDETWLKEGFADFMAHLILVEKGHKIGFEIVDPELVLAGRKDWGYSADSKSTTHPIEADVPSSDQADDMFDAISYSKGAEAIKQLYYFAGKNNFTESMKLYFAKYKFKCANVDDLVGCFMEVCSHNRVPQINLEAISKWKNQWICKAGTNVIRLTGFSSKSLTITQTSILPNHDHLRYHFQRVALINKTGKIVSTPDLMITDAPKIEVSLPGLSDEIAAVLLNDGDLDFSRSETNEGSLVFLLTHHSSLSPPSALRTLMVYKSAYDAVRTGSFDGAVFLNLAIQHADFSWSPTLGYEVTNIVTSVYQAYLRDHHQFAKFAGQVGMFVRKARKYHWIADDFEAHILNLVLLNGLVVSNETPTFSQPQISLDLLLNLPVSAARLIGILSLPIYSDSKQRQSLIRSVLAKLYPKMIPYLDTTTKGQTQSTEVNLVIETNLLFPLMDWVLQHCRQTANYDMRSVLREVLGLRRKTPQLWRYFVRWLLGCAHLHESFKRKWCEYLEIVAAAGDEDKARDGLSEFDAAAFLTVLGETPLSAVPELGIFKRAVESLHKHAIKDNRGIGALQEKIFASSACRAARSDPK